MTLVTPLPRSTPEAQGIASSAISAFVNAVEQQIQHLHSFMLLRHGAVVAEGWWQPYQPASVHMLYSLSKSFTSTAIGLATHEGLFSIDDKVISFFPRLSHLQSEPYIQDLKVRHLLSMSTGQEIDAVTRDVRNQPDWAQLFFEMPIEHPPGTFFLYNSAATYMLSAILQHLTGMTLLEYLRPRLLEPLGITQADWESCPRGINTGGWGLRITTDAIARFGQCYLQQGMWQGQQLIPAAWVAEASKFQSNNGDDPRSDWTQGYGYQFWRCRHNAYRADGAFGQFCVIMPEQQAVLATTAGLGDMQPVLDLVWEYLLPAFEKQTLPDNLDAQASLKQKLDKLVLPMPPGSATAAISAQVSKKTYYCEPNPSEINEVILNSGTEQSILTLHGPQGEQRIVAGHGSWKPGTARFYHNDPSEQPAAASAAWTSDTSHTTRIYFTETPYSTDIVCHFDGDRLHLRDEQNVSFGPTLRAELWAEC